MRLLLSLALSLIPSFAFGQRLTVADDQRAHAAVALLQKYCISRDANPTTINRRATEAGFAVAGEGTKGGIYHKWWRVGAGPGMMGLGTSRSSVPGRYMCNVAIPRGSAVAAAAESILTHDPRFGAPTKWSTSLASAVVWVVNLGPETTPAKVVLIPDRSIISVAFGFSPSSLSDIIKQRQ